MSPLQQAFQFTGASAEPPPRPNVVIEAGAGTGKTTAIVAEVLKLMLSRDDLAPERIVLMTFTEKAAGEIADRIRAALEELVVRLPVRGSELPGDMGRLQWPLESSSPLVTIDDVGHARRAIEHHLANIDSLRSQTIHSFCQSLLRSFPLEAGLDPQFKIIEGFERSLLYGQVYDAWLDDETRVNPTGDGERELELLFTHAGYLFQIRDLILTLAERRDLLEEGGYDFGEFAEAGEPLLDALHAIRRCADDAGDEHARRIFAYIRETEPRFTTLDECIDYLQPIASSIREANLPRPAVLKDALKILRAGNKGRSLYDRLVSHRAAIALVSLTRRFVAYLDAEKRKLGVVDFDDLLLRTLALLGDDAVLARARAQFDSIFVDEFQDTDRTQARIIERLARDGSGRYVPGKTIVVGDPKQSIYGFRRADPETYYRMTQDLQRDGAERRVIADQYRSDAPLLEVVNAMFVRLFPPDAPHDPNVFRPSYNTLRPARSSSRRDLDARVTMLHATHDDRQDRYFAEAEAIAAWIAKNRDGGPRDLQRFAILFRRLTKIDDYLDTFDRHGIDYVLPPTRLFLDRRAPVDLLAVLRAIGYAFDRGAQISAARTPYFALTDVEIARGVMERAEEVPAETETGAWAAFSASMSRFRDAARHLTVSQLIDLVIETTGIERVYEAAADGDRQLRHLEHVRRIAFEYDLRAGGSVRQFVDEIARRRAEPEEMEPSLLDDSQNAVRIMSVHAAKGLEFETVILPDLSSPGGNDSLQLFAVEEPRSLVLSGRVESISGNFRYAGDEKLKKISGRRDEAELRRLFYVAVTRAMTDVVFVCNMHEETRNVGFAKCLGEVLGADRDALTTMWPDDGRELRETPIGAVAFERMPPQTAGARKRRRLRDAALERELAAAEPAPCDVAAPEEIAARLAPGDVAARRAGSRNRAAGILLHRVLELWNGRDDVESLVRQLARETAADAEAVTHVRARLTTIVRSPTFARIAAAETIGREVPVRFVEDGAIVERRIDRLIRENGRLTVVDYKSGTATPTRIEKDRRQVATYSHAIATITGSECDGLVWYVDGDEAIGV